jgi:hypothetical protein
MFEEIPRERIDVREVGFDPFTKVAFVFEEGVEHLEILGSAAASAAVRRALAPNTDALGRTKRWVDSMRQMRLARARPAAPGAGALPIPTVLQRFHPNLRN